MSERRDLILKRLSEEGEAALAFFRGLDQADWERRIYSEGSRWTVTDLRTDLEALNGHVLAYLDQLSADETALDRRGQHAVFGDISVGVILRRIYRHEREHAQEIRTALQG